MAKTDLHFAGDDYVPVADRIRLFYERFPSGRIITRLVRRTDDEVVVKAAVYRTVTETRPAATGLAAEREGDGDINTFACLENTETSAIGRALANLGFAASANRPSVDQIESANRTQAPTPRPTKPATRDTPLAAPDPQLQRRADHAIEVITLLRRAERLGLSAEKRRVFKNRLARTDIDGRTLHRIARRLRQWLDLRFDRTLEPL